MPLISGRRNSPQIKSSPNSLTAKASPSLRPSLSNTKRDKKENSPLVRASPLASPSLRPHSSPALHHSPQPVAPALLDLRIESPPLVLYGNPNESTGCLLSGIFDVIIKQDAPFAMAKVDLIIYQQVEQKKPNPQKCAACTSHVTELARWNVLSHPADLPKGKHGYPFSHLIPGSVPASCDNACFSVAYFLKAVAIPVKSSPSNSSHFHGISAAPIELVLPLKVSRSIIKGPDRNSVRVFPPTDLAATITMPSVAYPLSNFSFELILEGVVAQLKNRTARWRMRKINWRVDQTIKMNWGFCDEHKLPPPPPPAPANEANASQSGSNGNQSADNNAASSNNGNGSGNTNSTSQPENGATLHPTSSAAESNPSAPQQLASDGSHTAHHSHAKKGKHRVQKNDKDEYEENVTIASGEYKEGWKSDFSGKGKIEFNGTNIIIPSSVCCRVEDPVFGLTVSHVLVIELVIAEETQTARSSRQTIPTGAARVLRMQFNIIVTDRSGLGISWDDEVPPVYADVPLSPPDYANVAELPKFEDLTPSVSVVQGINSALSLESPSINALP